MTVLKDLSYDQKRWFAQVAMQLIWADGDLALSEYENFQMVIQLFDDNETQISLVDQLEGGQIEERAIPEDLPKEVLSEVYLELLSFAISDWSVGPEEKSFLENLAVTLNFTKDYRAKLFRWANLGMNWQRQQQDMLPEGTTAESSTVVVGQLDGQQKYWYAEVLIGAIVLDGIVDQAQFEPLKAALSFITDHKQKITLLTKIKKSYMAKLTAPPAMEARNFYLIFFEILKIFAADDSLSFRETDFLNRYISLTGLPNELAKQGADWCRRGIMWKQERVLLAKKTEFNPDPTSSLQVSQDRWIPHEKNSSLQYRIQSCFLCGPSTKVNVRQLKPKTQKPQSNIFGVPVYGVPLNSSFEGMNFNLIKVNVCPKCGFASTDRNNFQTNRAGTPLDHFADTDFRSSWKKGIPGRKKALSLIQSEADLLSPSINYIQATYQLALESLAATEAFHSEPGNQWKDVMLRLTLAEVLKSSGKSPEALTILKAVSLKAKDMMSNSRDDLSVIQAAKLLFMVALYFDKPNAAMSYYNFFNTLKTEKVPKMEPGVQKRFKSAYTSVRKAFGDRQEYSHKKLKTYSLHR